MGCCSGCKSEINNDECGCGTSRCKPFSIPPGCYHCPPPPPIDPCGCRIEGGVEIPVWHPDHPLIPMFRSCYSAAIDPACCDETTNKSLAWLLSISEGLFSTCKFDDGRSGGKYHQAIMLHAAAMMDLARRFGMAESAWVSTIVSAKSFNTPIPLLENSIYGQMLNALLRSAPNGDVCLVV